MTDSSSIPVQAGPGADPAANLRIAATVLREIMDALEQLIAAGTTGIIDLRLLPHMRAGTYQYLKDSLSCGEVTAVVDADRQITVAETQYPGVWWLTHRNEQGAIVTEFIEITVIPEILKPHAADMRAGLMRLKRAVTELVLPEEPQIAGDLD